MRTKNIMRHLAWGVLGLATTQVFSQATQDDNNGGFGSFLGWDAGANQILEVTNEANQPIQWRTNNVLRMRLRETLTGQTANGYLGLDLSGHLGIGPLNNMPNTNIPLTYLHIDNGGTQETAYRPWMRTGTAMSEASCWMYTGLKRHANDRIDAVVNWGDNNEHSTQWGPDALRFIFTRNPNNSTTAADDDGLELARIIPAANGNEGFFGIGDYFTLGLQPEERLDILDGRLRIRQLPTDPEADYDKVMVVDDDGVVHWRDFLDFAGQPDCDWEEDVNGWASCDATDNYAIGTTTTPLSTKFTVNNSDGENNIVRIIDEDGDEEMVIDADGNVSIDGDVGDNNSTVGIGTGNPADSKLRVNIHNGDGLNNILRLRGETIHDILDVRRDGELSMGSTSYSPKFNIGHPTPSSNDKDLVFITNRDSDNERVMQLRSNVSGTEIPFVAYTDGAASVNGPRRNNDVMFTVNEWNGPNADLFLVYNDGDVSIGGVRNTTHKLSVYGSAAKNNANTAWDTWSDAAIKDNISPFTDGLEHVRQIEPVNFTYNGLLGTDTSRPYVGVVAQDVQQIAPYMVGEHEVYLDTADLVTTPMLSYNPTALQYMLVNAVKELDSANTAQEEKIAELEAMLTYCCTIISDQGLHAPEGGGNNGDTKIETIWPDGTMQNAVLFQNQPNPFRQNTTIKYDLGLSGEVELVITNMNGTEIDQLVNEAQESGSYSLEWDTQGLAPGIYFYSLIVDGQLWVKKAVKIQ